MVKSLRTEPCRGMLCMLLVSLLLFIAQAAQAAGKTTVWQETDKSQDNYLKNRRALVGNGCVVNRIFDGVKVIGGVKDLQNLVNDDLSDYAVMPSVADVGTIGEPLISVKDLDHAYAAGTEAGFMLEAASGSSLLSVDISSFYKLWFYRNGNKVGEASVEQGQQIGGVSLSLLQIPGNDAFTMEIVGAAPAEFDEVMLVQAGVDVSVLSSVNICYAFVGKAHQYTLTNSAEGGISDYAADTGRGEITVEGHGGSFNISTSAQKEMVDDKLGNGYTVEAVLSLGSSFPATVATKCADGKETFAAGTEVGFVFTSTAVLTLSAVKSTTLILYDASNKELGQYPVSTSVLGLSVVSKEKGGFVIKAPVAFSSARVLFPTGVTVDLGAITVNYAFVRTAPDAASHHCPIDVMADRSVCDCNNVYYLKWTRT